MKPIENNANTNGSSPSQATPISLAVVTPFQPLGQKPGSPTSNRSNPIGQLQYQQQTQIQSQNQSALMSSFSSSNPAKKDRTKQLDDDSSLLYCNFNPKSASPSRFRMMESAFLNNLQINSMTNQNQQSSQANTSFTQQQQQQQQPTQLPIRRTKQHVAAVHSALLHTTDQRHSSPIQPIVATAAGVSITTESVKRDSINGLRNITGNANTSNNKQGLSFSSAVGVFETPMKNGGSLQPIQQLLPKDSLPHIREHLFPKSQQNNNNIDRIEANNSSINYLLSRTKQQNQLQSQQLLQQQSPSSSFNVQVQFSKESISPMNRSTDSRSMQQQHQQLNKISSIASFTSNHARSSLFQQLPNVTVFPAESTSTTHMASGILGGDSTSSLFGLEKLKGYHTDRKFRDTGSKRDSLGLMQVQQSSLEPSSSRSSLLLPKKQIVLGNNSGNRDSQSFNFGSTTIYSGEVTKIGVTTATAALAMNSSFSSGLSSPKKKFNGNSGFSAAVSGTGAAAASSRKLHDFFVKRLNQGNTNTSRSSSSSNGTNNNQNINKQIQEISTQQQSVKYQQNTAGEEKISSADLSNANRGKFLSPQSSKAILQFASSTLLNVTLVGAAPPNLAAGTAPASIDLQFEKQLVAEVSTAFTDVPRSRNDMKLILEWFERMRCRLEEEGKSIEIEERRRRQCELLRVCFDELQAQIRVEFSERADLLRRVWEENARFYSSFIDEFDAMKMQLINAANAEFTRVHTSYQTLLREKEIEIEAAKRETNVAHEKSLALKQELEAELEAHRIAKESLSRFKKICVFLKKKLSASHAELKGLRERIDERVKYSKQQFLSDFYKDQLFQAKQANKTSLAQDELLANLAEQIRQLEQKQHRSEHPLQNQSNGKASDAAASGSNNVKTKNDVDVDVDVEYDDEGNVIKNNDNTRGNEEERSDEDSDFVFEYQEGDDVVQGIDQLNAVVFQSESDAKHTSSEVQVEDDLRLAYTTEMFAQTDLYLSDRKFDAIMFDNESMNDVFDFYAYKQHMDEIAVRIQAGKMDFHDVDGDAEDEIDDDISGMSYEKRKMKSIQEEDEDNQEYFEEEEEEDEGGNEELDGENGIQCHDDDDDINVSTASKNEQGNDKDASMDNNVPVRKSVGGYDNVNEQSGRKKIRKRVSSVQQNHLLLHPNRQLSLSLDQYLMKSIFSRSNAMKVGENESQVVADSSSLKEGQQQEEGNAGIKEEKVNELKEEDVGELGNIRVIQEEIQLNMEQKQGEELEQPISQSSQQLSTSQLHESNSHWSKVRSELKQQLNGLLQPKKLSKILVDAGLKVTKLTTETKLEKFLKIYQLAQVRAQELRAKVDNITQVLSESQEISSTQAKALEHADSIKSQQAEEIARLNEELRLAHQRVLAAQTNVVQAGGNANEEEKKKGEEKGKPSAAAAGLRVFRARKETRVGGGGFGFNGSGASGNNAFQLGKRVNMEWEFQKQQNSGKLIVERAKDKKMAKFSNFLTQKTLLKQIGMLYNERLSCTKESASVKDIEFANFAYNYYSSQYGVKKIADQKFLILILSVKKYVQILRVNVFAKFLGLVEGPHNYSNDELNKYVEVFDFIMNISQAGSNYTNNGNNDSEVRFLVPYIKAVHYISQFGDSRMRSEENAELRRDVESMKVLDASRIPVIDFDAYMGRLLQTYRVLVNRAKQYVINAFNACDLDGNRKCNYSEWSLLNRHIEPTKFDDDQLEGVFEANADIVEEDGEKNFSFDKFAVVSLEYELFSDEAQDRYLEITGTPANNLQITAILKEKYEAIVAKWPTNKLVFELRLEKLKNVEQETIEEWKNIIQVLDQKLCTPMQTFQVAIGKPLLIAHSILDKESSMLEKVNEEYLLTLPLKKKPSNFNQSQQQSSQNVLSIQNLKDEDEATSAAVISAAVIETTNKSKRDITATNSAKLII